MSWCDIYSQVRKDPSASRTAEGLCSPTAAPELSDSGTRTPCSQRSAVPAHCEEEENTLPEKIFGKKLDLSEKHFILFHIYNFFINKTEFIILYSCYFTSHSYFFGKKKLTCFLNILNIKSFTVFEILSNTITKKLFFLLIIFVQTFFFLLVWKDLKTDSLIFGDHLFHWWKDTQTCSKTFPCLLVKWVAAHK